MLPRPIPRETRDLLGEGPVWVPERNRLFWVDILAPALNWLDLASGEVGRRVFHERIGWIIPRASRSDFVVGLKSGFHLFDPDAGTLRFIGDPEPDRPDNRLNDAKVDHAGRPRMIPTPTPAARSTGSIPITPGRAMTITIRSPTAPPSARMAPRSTTPTAARGRSSPSISPPMAHWQTSACSCVSKMRGATRMA